MTNPQRKQLADLVRGRSGTNAEIADAVNAESLALVSRFITKTSIYAAVGFTAGLQLSGALEAMAASDNAAVALQGREILSLLDPTGSGVDVALPEVRNVIDALTAQGVMTAQTAATIKSLGERRSLDFVVTADDVASAKDLLNRIAAQEAAHRTLSNEYATRAFIGETVLNRLNQGELATVVEVL